MRTSRLSTKSISSTRLKIRGNRSVKNPAERIRLKSAKKKKNAPKIPAVTRRAFTMRLKPGSFDEYKKYHDNIWPELVREIEKSGIAQITTFENEMQLFLYSEIYDEKAWDRLWISKIHDKWSESMGPLMQFGADGK